MAATTDGISFNPIADMTPRQKAIIMAGTMLGLFTAAMDQTIVGTSMPRIIAQLGGFGLFAWVGTGFMLASTCTLPVVGKLSDIFGRKPFYMSGIVILLIGSALCGSSQNIEQLIAFRVIQGIGAGMIMGLAFAILGDGERAGFVGERDGGVDTDELTAASDSPHLIARARSIESKRGGSMVADQKILCGGEANG